MISGAHSLGHLVGKFDWQVFQKHVEKKRESSPMEVVCCCRMEQKQLISSADPKKTPEGSQSWWSHWVRHQAWGFWVFKLGLLIQLPKSFLFRSNLFLFSLSSFFFSSFLFLSFCHLIEDHRPSLSYPRTVSFQYRKNVSGFDQAFNTWVGYWI